MDHLLSQSAKIIKPYPLRDLKSAIGHMDLIFLNSSAHSPDASPTEEMKEIIGRLAAEHAAGVMFSVRDELKQEAVQILEGRKISTTAENVTILNNAQRALELVGKTLLDPGDVVLLEVPAHSGAIICFANLNAHIEPVAIDAGGIDIEKLEKALHRLKGEGKTVKLLYTMPTFQNPTAMTLAGERRKELAAIAEREDFIILENDLFADMWFTGEESFPFEPISSHVKDRTIYLAGYAGIIAPGLRSIYLHGPELLIQKIEYASESADLAAGSIEHRTIIELIRTGILDTAMKRARRIYWGQCLAMLEALEQYMPENVTWKKPKGGFYLWLELPNKYKTVDLLNKSVQQGVAFIPGLVFDPAERENNFLRLSFSAETKKRIKMGVAFLANAIRFWDIREKVPWALGDFCSRCNDISRE